MGIRTELCYLRAVSQQTSNKTYGGDVCVLPAEIASKNSTESRKSRLTSVTKVFLFRQKQSDERRERKSTDESRISTSFPSPRKPVSFCAVLVRSGIILKRHWKGVNVNTYVDFSSVESVVPKTKQNVSDFSV